MSAQEIPLFVPTSTGPIFGIVSLPEADVPLREPGVLLLPGGRAGAGVLPLLQSVARELAEHGQPVVRFDYPGSGLSADQASVPQSALRDLVHEVADWFVSETGVKSLAVAGRCGGGRLALALPSVDDRVVVCVGVVPFFALGGWSIRSRLAELDARGPRLASRLIRAPRAEGPREPRRDVDEVAAEFAADLTAAIGKARTSVIFGQRDGLLEQFNDFIESRLLRGVAEALEVVVLPDARLHGLPNVDHERLLGDEIRSRLAAPEVVRG